MWFRLVEDEEVDIIVPNIGVFAVFLRQSLGIIHIAQSCIVGGQDKLHPFDAIGHLVFETTVEIAEELATCMKLLGGSGVVVDAIFLHHHGHKLHEAKGAFFAFQIKLEMRFLINERSQQTPIPANLLGSLFDDVVEERDMVA